MDLSYCSFHIRYVPHDPGSLLGKGSSDKLQANTSNLSTGLRAALEPVSVNGQRGKRVPEACTQIKKRERD